MRFTGWRNDVLNTFKKHLDQWGNPQVRQVSPVRSTEDSGRVVSLTRFTVRISARNPVSDRYAEGSSWWLPARHYSRLRQPPVHLRGRLVADHVVDRVRSPVFIELCLIMRDFFGDAVPVRQLADLTDEDLYEHIVFAGSLQHSRHEFVARPTPELDGTAAAVLRRLSTGVLGDTSLRSPQARFTKDATPRPVHVTDGSARTDKPVGALWTSSFLPGGTSMWQWGEGAEFGPGRRLFTTTFDPTGVRLFTIDSPADYEHLVRRYPHSSEGRARVHWSRAAEDLDAVHLTVTGLLTAQHVPVRTPHGTALLTDWDAESTAWLHLPADLRMTPTPP
ncbi:hypothetical protein [Actinosynnema sp. NPDC023587]|uniref:hypothetical protein n=1 Tax=Actinosynnema sp. NPDC023587 TaxID=3154695 RepID=UPI0033FC2C09